MYYTAGRLFGGFDVGPLNPETKDCWKALAGMIPFGGKSYRELSAAVGLAAYLELELQEDVLESCWDAIVIAAEFEQNLHNDTVDNVRVLAVLAGCVKLEESLPDSNVRVARLPHTYIFKSSKAHAVKHFAWKYLHKHPELILRGVRENGDRSVIRFGVREYGRL
jgi:hypothetical protein